jgi:uncharacterized protein YecT (DUF1311 family)
MRKISLMLLLLITLSLAPSGQGSQVYASTFDEYHVGMLKASPEYRRLDRELNQTYGKLLGLLDPAARANLQSEQRQWLKKRQTTIDMLLRNEQEAETVLVNLTQRRLQELRTVLNSFENSQIKSGESPSPNYSGTYSLTDPARHCNGEMRVLQKGPDIQVTISTVCGRTAHTCDFKGQGVLANDAVFLTDESAPECKIAVKFSRNTAEVMHEPLSPCCGANGYMWGKYVRKR